MGELNCKLLELFWLDVLEAIRIILIGFGLLFALLNSMKTWKNKKFEKLHCWSYYVQQKSNDSKIVKKAEVKAFNNARTVDCHHPRRRGTGCSLFLLNLCQDFFSSQQSTLAWHLGIPWGCLPDFTVCQHWLFCASLFIHGNVTTWQNTLQYLQFGINQEICKNEFVFLKSRNLTKMNKAFKQARV